MALVDCPECNRNVSDKANACPGCGYPLNNSEPKDKNKSKPKKLEKPIKICSSCEFKFTGNELTDMICPSCGIVNPIKNNDGSKNNTESTKQGSIKPIAIERNPESENNIAESKTNSSSSLIYWGYMLPSTGYLVFGGLPLSLIGFIIGAINTTRGNVFHGIAHMCLSAIVFALTILGIATIGLMEIVFNGY